MFAPSQRSGQLSMRAIVRATDRGVSSMACEDLEVEDLDDRPSPKMADDRKKREFVYVLGGAGVGKSTWTAKNLEATHEILDPDRLQALCPLEDPKPDAQGSPTYLWCKEQCKLRVEQALAADADGTRSFAMLGTGKLSVVRRLEARGEEHPKIMLLRQARSAGYRTRVVCLHCPIEVALARNASRPRALADEHVRETVLGSNALYELLRAEADACEEHDVSEHHARSRGRRASMGISDRMHAFHLSSSVRISKTRQRAVSLESVG